MIHALVGEEVFLLKRALDKLLAERIPTDLKDFNWDPFDGGEIEADRVIERLSTLPTLSSRRVVLIRDADQILKKEAERLAAFLPHIPETTDLILTATRPDRRLTFWQEVAKRGKIQEFRPLYEREVPQWIREEVKRGGFQMAPDALQFLAQAVGTDLSLLHATLEKIFLLIGEKREIRVEDVASTVASSAWKKVFDLTDAVARKDLPLTLKIFREMTAARESPVALIGQLAWHLRTLEKVKRGEVSGLSPFVVNRYRGMSEKSSFETLDKGRDRLFFADWALKSSPLPPEVVFERLLIDLCR